MKISKQNRKDAKALFRISIVNGRLDEGRVRQIVERVLAGKPRGYLGVLAHFQRLLRLEIARRAAKVESATPLSAELRTQIEGNLAQIYGPGLNVVYQEAPSLVGGLRIQVGSDVYDGSVASRLRELEESF